jgi:hypothetical protein
VIGITSNRIVKQELVCQQVAGWFRSEGYDPCVAVALQTILELSSGIMGVTLCIAPTNANQLLGECQLKCRR